jgi:hypothetical protein
MPPAARHWPTARYLRLTAPDLPGLREGDYEQHMPVSIFYVHVTARLTQKHRRLSGTALSAIFGSLRD